MTGHPTCSMDAPARPVFFLLVLWVDSPVCARQVVSSTFDNFTQHLDTYRSNLTVFTGEIGDSWIYGCVPWRRRVRVSGWKCHV